MALILHIETATAVCSAALSRGSDVVAIRETEGLVHGEMLAVFIRDLLAEAGCRPSDLDAVSVSTGPGSYTGLRVGLSTAKGLAFGLDIPLLAIPTTEALALATAAGNPGHWVLACIDARRLEVYAALYAPDGGCLREATPVILNETDGSEWLGEAVTPVLACGDGAAKTANLWSDYGVQDARIRCSARHLTAPALMRWEAGQWADLDQLEPDYVKPARVTTPSGSSFPVTRS